MAPAPDMPTILDNMIADKRLPLMIAVMVMPNRTPAQHGI